MVEHWKENGYPAYMTLAHRYGMVQKSAKGGTGDLEELASMFGNGVIE